MAIQSMVDKGKEQGKGGEGFPGLSNQMVLWIN